MRHQIKILTFSTLCCLSPIVLGVKPAGLVELPKSVEGAAPKYAYNYVITDDVAKESQGHEEKRDGINTSGSFYFATPAARSDVNYFVDDWGFHAVNKYSNQGPHSRVSGHFALGYEAVQALHSDGQPKSAEVTLKQGPANVQPPLAHQDQYPQYVYPMQQQFPVEQQFPAQQQFPVLQPNLAAYQPVYPSFLAPISNNIVSQPDNFVSYQEPPQYQPEYQYVQANEAPTAPSLQQQQQQPQQQLQQEYEYDPSLVLSTKDLVIGQDLININGAQEKQEEKVLFTKNKGEAPTVASSGQTSSHTNATIKEHEEQRATANRQGHFAANPIIVEDVYENNKLSGQVSGDAEVKIVPSREYNAGRALEYPDRQINVQIIKETPVEIRNSFVKQTTASVTTEISYREQEPPVNTTPLPTVEAIESTQRPSTKFLAPINAGLRLSNEGKAFQDCIHGHSHHQVESQESVEQNEKTTVEVLKSVNVKNIFIQENAPILTAARVIDIQPQAEKLVQNEQVVQQEVVVPQLVKVLQYQLPVPTIAAPVSQQVDITPYQSVVGPSYHTEPAHQATINQNSLSQGHFLPINDLFYKPLVHQQHPYQFDGHQHHNHHHHQQQQQQQHYQQKERHQQPFGLQNGYLPPFAEFTQYESKRPKATYGPPVPMFSNFNTISQKSYADKYKHKSFRSDEYLGPIPPMASDFWATTQKRSLKLKRTPDHGRSLKLEYGFKPPMVPSLEIDLNGEPVKKLTT